MKFRSAIQLLAVGVVALVVADASADYKKSGTSSVSFHANGSAGMKIDGKTSDLEFTDGKVVRVKVPLANLDTGMALRNKHMKEKYLEVDKYPNAELAVPKDQLKIPSNGMQKANGTFTMHGVTKGKSFSYKVEKDGDGYKVEGWFSINITEHGIAEPGYLGVKVKPDVDVDVSFHVKE